MKLLWVCLAYSSLCHPNSLYISAALTLTAFVDFPGSASSLLEIQPIFSLSVSPPLLSHTEGASSKHLIQKYRKPLVMIKVQFSFFYFIFVLFHIRSKKLS